MSFTPPASVICIMSVVDVYVVTCGSGLSVCGCGLLVVFLYEKTIEMVVANAFTA